MLIVAPRGSTKEATSRSAPSFSAHSMFSGSVPTDEAEENAIIMAGIMPLKNLAGLRLPNVLTEIEYTTKACTM